MRPKPILKDNLCFSDNVEKKKIEYQDNLLIQLSPLNQNEI